MFECRRQNRAAAGLLLLLSLCNSTTQPRSFGCPLPPHYTRPAQQNKLAIMTRLKQSARTHVLAPRKFHIHSQMAEAKCTQDRDGKNKTNQIKISKVGRQKARFTQAPSLAACWPASCSSAADSTASAAACARWSCPTAQQAARAATISAQPSPGTRACRGATAV